jgi:uncharacterized protein
VLVPGAGPVDRDETVAGISVFAQLGVSLADGGFMVLRYDKRGVGQSGGRDETAALRDFADDVRSVVAYLRKRKDVDPDHIAVIGHGEGGSISMAAAADARKDIAALVLIACPGFAGGDLGLEQQRHLLDRMTLPDDERRNRMELQQRIQHAVLTGNGWENIPAAYRRQADTPWFRSFLEFDPAKVMPRLSQPVLVIQGSRDRQVTPRHAFQLVEFAKARRKDPGADLLMADGVNHLMVPAPTGEIDEYPMLEDKRVSPKVIASLNAWLKDKLYVAPARAGQ